MFFNNVDINLKIILKSLKTKKTLKSLCLLKLKTIQYITIARKVIAINKKMLKTTILIVSLVELFWLL